MYSLHLEAMLAREHLVAYSASIQYLQVCIGVVLSNLLEIVEGYCWALPAQYTNTVLREMLHDMGYASLQTTNERSNKTAYYNSMKQAECRNVVHRGWLKKIIQFFGSSLFKNHPNKFCGTSQLCQAKCFKQTWNGLPRGIVFTPSVNSLSQQQIVIHSLIATVSPFSWP